MMTSERSMEAHKIECIKWLVLLPPQLTGKMQKAYAAPSSEHSKNFTKVKETIFKRYDINEEMYHQRLGEGERVSYQDSNPFNDMAAKWLKEHDTRVKMIKNMIVMEQFITMAP